VFNPPASRPIVELAGNGAGKVMAIWNQSTPVPGTFEHKYNTWVSEYEAGTGWLPPRSLGNDVYELDGSSYMNPQSVPGHYLPTISIDDQGNAFAMWLEVDFAGDVNHITMNHYRVGNGWGTPQAIGSTPANEISGFYSWYSDYSSLAFGNPDSAYVGWTTTETLDNSVRTHLSLARYETATGWTTEKVLENHPYSVSAPEVVVGRDGNPFVLWVQYSDDCLQYNGQCTTELRGATHTAAAGWSTARSLSGTGAVGGYKTVRDGDGNVTLIWIQSSAVWAKVIQ
jgi:hypothetical protein